MENTIIIDVDLYQIENLLKTLVGELTLELDGSGLSDAGEEYFTNGELGFENHVLNNLNSLCKKVDKIKKLHEAADKLIEQTKRNE